MLVDDDQDILDLLEYNLIKEGYEVRKVNQSNTAIDLASDFNPDLFVLDVMMPVLNGIELCNRIRQSNQFEKTQVLFLSAMSNSDIVHQAYENGANEYYDKMSGIKSLIDKIKVIMDTNFGAHRFSATAWVDLVNSNSSKWFI